MFSDCKNKGLQEEICKAEKVFKIFFTKKGVKNH